MVEADTGATGTHKKKSGLESSGGTQNRVEERGNVVGNNTGKSQDGADNNEKDGERSTKEKTKRNKKKTKKTRDSNTAGDSDGSHGDTTAGTSRLTARSDTANTTSGADAVRSRDTVREQLMNQVLRDYHAKPTVKAEVAVKQYRWPLFGLRRMLGLAHVELHDAVLDGNIEIVKGTLIRYVRKYPRKINEYDHDGRSPLSLALMEAREDIADLIISVEETDVNKTDKMTGLSPLHNAVLLDLESSAQKLAFRGANVNATDKVGMTPLMLACRLGHGSFVEMLVDVFGAELDLEDQAGWNCLFYAVYHNEVAIAETLLMRGVDPEHCDNEGMKAIDWGEYMGFGNTCSLFERFQPQLA